MGIFSQENFLDDEAGGPMSTERVLIPADTYKGCYIKDVKPQEGLIKKGDRTGQPWARVNFVWVIDSPELRDKLIRAEVTINQGIMLDLDDNGEIDTRKGRNVRLGRLRKALGINDGPIRWRDFVNKPATLQIEHKPSDLNGEPTEEIVAVAGV